MSTDREEIAEIVRVCAYGKTGGRDMKSLQLVRTGAGWRISAAAWDDER